MRLLQGIGKRKGNPKCARDGQAICRFRCIDRQGADRVPHGRPLLQAQQRLTATTQGCMVSTKTTSTSTQ